MFLNLCWLGWFSFARPYSYFPNVVKFYHEHVFIMLYESFGIIENGDGIHWTENLLADKLTLS